MHWGVYSVPSYISEWFWWYWQGTKTSDAVKFMQKNYRPGFTYADFAADFKAEFFDPDRFAEVVKKSGARYFVHTTKHHEGYTMYPSNFSWNWNSMDVGPKRDIVGDLQKAFQKVGGIRFGLYFSLFEWFNPLYLADKHHLFLKQDYVKMVARPQLEEIVTNYQPEVIWSDGDWEAPDRYWNSTDFIAWLYNKRLNTFCGFPDVENMSIAALVGNMGVQGLIGHLIKHKWENCLTVDSKSWGFRRNMNIEDILSVHQLVKELVKTVSCGGNMLLNIGPTHDGRIVPVFEERLLQMGQWLKVNGEAIYGSKPWIYQNDTVNPEVWYTSKLRNDSGWSPSRKLNTQSKENTIVYASFLSWPKYNTLYLGAPKATVHTKVFLLGYPENLYSGSTWLEGSSNGLKIDLSAISFNKLPSTVAWVLKLEYLADQSKE